MLMPRPVHFEFSADDPDRAVKFYSSVFGWKFAKWGGPFDYWVITTGKDPEPGIDGGMTRRQPGGGGPTTIAVPSLDHYLEKVVAAGGTVVQPKGPIPGVGWFATFNDTEGNRFGLLEPDESAQ
jgi:uncharacterized protein